MGSATDINTHSIGKAIDSVEQNDTTAGSAAGQAFFIAIWEIRSGPIFNEVSDFNAYFKNGTTTTGASTPPHSNYRTVPWAYGS